MARVVQAEPVGPRVLLVEDHALIRQALCSALADVGLDVEAPDDLDPDAILAAARASSPQLVLLDFYLAEGDTLPLVAPLTELGARVIMLTGATDARVLGECVEAGAVAVVSKSQPLDSLVAAIADTASGVSVMRPAERDALVEAARRARAEERERRQPFDQLSTRERIVLQALLDGRSAEDIARGEYVSLATVRSQIRSILSKLGVNSQLAAVALARRNGWTG